MKSVHVTIIIAALSISPAARAGFDDLGAGARAPGMADAFVAIADDANAVYYNPAGLAQIKSLDVSAQHARFLSGISDGSDVGATFLGAAAPLKGGAWGTLGVSYQGFQASNHYDDRALALAYGKNLPSGLWRLPGQLSGGVGVKQFHRQYEADQYTQNALNDGGVTSGSPDPLFAKNGYGTNAFGLDLGAFYQFGEKNRYSAGLSFTNVNRPDLSLGGSDEKAPLLMRGGFAFRPRWGVVTAELRRSKRTSETIDTDTALGAERRVEIKNFGAIDFRGGYVKGSRGQKLASVGFSLQLSKVRLDYAFNLPFGDMPIELSSHRIGFSFRAGPSVPVRTVTPQEGYHHLRAHYLIRKVGGATVQERLMLLQQLYSSYGQTELDMGWLSEELNSL